MSYDPQQAKMEMNRRKLAEKWTGTYTPRDSEATHFISQDDARHNPGRVKHSDKGPGREP